MKNSSQKQTHTCPVCGYIESNNSSLETHMIISHCPDIAAQCPKCDKRLIHIDIMRIHMDTHHGSVALEEASDVLDCVDLTGEEDLFEHPDEKTFENQK